MARSSATRTTPAAADFIRLGKGDNIHFDVPTDFECATGGFCWEFWLRTTAWNVGRLITKRDWSSSSGVDAGWSIDISTGRMRMQLFKESGIAAGNRVTNGYVTTAAATTPICDGQWHHCLVVNDRANATEAQQKLHIYVDSGDAAAASSAQTENTTSIGCPTIDCYLRYYNSSDSAQPIDFKHIRYYTRALTAAEIAQVFDEDYDGLPVLAHYACDDGADNREVQVSKWIRSDTDISCECAVDPNLTNAILATAHPFIQHSTIRFTTTGTIPGGLTENAGYFVKVSSADEFSVSATAGGEDITITDVGTGVLTAHRQIHGMIASGKNAYEHETVHRLGAGDKKVLSAVMFSDLHHGSTSKLANLNAIIAFANARNPDLFVGLGDYIYDTTTKATNEGYLRAVHDAIDHADTGILGDITPYLIYGNHDRGSGAGVMTRAEVTAQLNAVATLMPISDGKVYHAQTINEKCLCLFLDAHDMNEIQSEYMEMSATQLAWIEAQLAASTLPKVVFHHSRTDINSGDLGLTQTAGNAPQYEAYGPSPAPAGHMIAIKAAELRALFEAGGVVAVCSGHQHYKHYVKLNGVHYVNIDAATDGANACLIRVWSNGDIACEGLGTQWNMTRR